MSDLKAWQRRRDLNESGPAYHAFEHFRDLGVRVRSLDRAYSVCQTHCERDKNLASVQPLKEPQPLPDRLLEASRTWKEWRRRFLWDARVDEWDQHLTDEKRAKAIEDATEMNDLHARIARAAMAKVVERLNAIKGADLSPGQAMKWMVDASKVERLARGKPTEIVKRDGDGMPDLSKLTDDEVEIFTQLLAKVQGESA